MEITEEVPKIDVIKRSTKKKRNEDLAPNQEDLVPLYYVENNNDNSENKKWRQWYNETMENFPLEADSTNCEIGEEIKITVFHIIEDRNGKPLKGDDEKSSWG